MNHSEKTEPHQRRSPRQPNRDLSLDAGDDAVHASARQLYNGFFWNRPAFHRLTGDTLLELLQKIEKFTRQKGVIVPASSCDYVFAQLTDGLLETLRDLDGEFRTSTLEEGLGRGGGPPNSSNSSRIQQYQERLRYYALTVDLVVEAIER